MVMIVDIQITVMIDYLKTHFLLCQIIFCLFCTKSFYVYHKYILSINTPPEPALSFQNQMRTRMVSSETIRVLTTTLASYPENRLIKAAFYFTTHSNSKKTTGIVTQDSR